MKFKKQKALLNRSNFLVFVILGLTGKNAAGKGEAASYLKAKGFIYYSLSDELREEATKRNMGHSRESLISLGNELREKFGPEYLAKKINEKIKNKKNNIKNFVVDSIRSPFEAKELLKNKDSLLIGIDAPVGLRFQRMVERNRVGDAKTIEDFKRQEGRENTKNETSQQLNETFKLAGKAIINDGSLESLHEKIDELLEELSKVKF